MTDFDTDLLLIDRRNSSRRRRAESVTGSEPVETASEIPPVAAAPEDKREIADRRRQDRRRQIDPTTCERDYSLAEIEFMRAMDDYKRRSGRPFPTWSEVLEVINSLGYRKVAEPSQMAWRTFGDQ
jgi:hypothetical protein